MSRLHRELQVHIERPKASGGAAIAVVGQRVIVEGWAQALGGVARVSILFDDQALDIALHDEGKPGFDQTANGGNQPQRVGFTAACPTERLAPGEYVVQVALEAKDGRQVSTGFVLRLQRQPPFAAAPWRPRPKMPVSEIGVANGVLDGLRWHPHFALLIGIGEIDAEVAAARLTLASLRGQAYAAWRAVVVRRGRTLPADCAPRLLDGFDDIADRIELRLDAPATAPLAALATPSDGAKRADLLGVLLGGDVLGCDALIETAIVSGLYAEDELFYSDEYRTSPASGDAEAFFKPQWSPELLAATNYLGRFWCALPGVFARAGATLGEWIEFGDYDLVLRCTEATNGIRHIPRVLCERGRAQLDSAEQEQAALQRAMSRRGEDAMILRTKLPGSYRVKRKIIGRPSVSIVIPTCASEGHIKTCLETLRRYTAHIDFEIICIENIPAPAESWRQWLKGRVDRLITIREPYNWARYNNLAAAEARGEFLVFLNDDIEILAEGWLEALLEQAQRPEIGVVGARLLYPDRKIQHAGLFWTPRGGRHAFRFAGEAAPGYFGLALVERNVLAVTGACMVMRRGDFAACGGFDEKHEVTNNDVDYCLRCWERGLRVVYTPHATLIHHELASRHSLPDSFDEAAFAARWGRRLAAGDPFYHPLLSRDRDDSAYDPEPVELVYPARPLFDAGQVRDILVVKLDHIGDLLTAAPALRRLREVFPQARLHLLAGPWAAQVRDWLPPIDNLIAFEFFFRESRLGQRDRTPEEWSMLQQRLAGYTFDLAIDLRKPPETRPLLRLTGATWLAGYDCNSQFPWLDIALEWEEDPRGVRKHSHISEDLLRLVDAVAAAVRTDVPRPPLAGPRADNLADAAPPGRRLVCMHPGVGTPIRRWPAAHFAELIKMLLSAQDVEIVLIGHADEAEVAEEILSLVRRPDCVRSLAGEVELADLPGLLAEAALFVGNNSGPHHLAAGLGVPTVGIHSGTVDPREWGPVGPSAVAIRRDMVCSPCYLHDASLCRRGLTCMTELMPSEVFEMCRRFLAADFAAARG